jgi:hypothetical protein
MYQVVLPAKITICCHYKSKTQELFHQARMPRRSHRRCGPVKSAVTNDHHVKGMLLTVLMTKRTAYVTTKKHRKRTSKSLPPRKLEVNTVRLMV